MMNTSQNSIPDTNNLRKELLDEIGAAVHRGDGPAISAAAERLCRFDALLIEARRLVKVDGQEVNHMVVSPVSTKPARGNSSFSHESIAERKQRGERVRSEWVEKLSRQGIALTPVRGALYRSNGGDIVGIACAREKEHRGGVWWSGLPYGKFQRAALLCEPNAGELFAVCLPRSFLEANGSRLSKTRAGQTHFTVVKRGSKVLLAGVDVTSYFNNYSLIA